MAIEPTVPGPPTATEGPPSGFQPPVPPESIPDLVGPDTDREPVLSIVLPTKDEEAGIAECLDAICRSLAELGVPGEIIVADSSTDRTPEIAAEWGAIVVEPEADGYGNAYRCAFEHVRGEYVAMGDADTTYDFRELPKLYARVADDDALQPNGGTTGRSGPADMVLGSRFIGEIRPGAMPPLHRYVGNPLLTAFLNVFYGAKVTDAHSGFRVLRREALEDLKLQSGGMEFASEMVMVAAARGMEIAEVPITYHERVGEATLESFADGWRHVRFMLLNAPGYLFSVPGVAMAVVGLTLMATTLVGTDRLLLDSYTLTLGARAMVTGSLLTIVGCEVVSLGVFATVASDPIRRPTDPVTTALVDRLSLEVGVTVGLVVFALGATYASYLVIEWLSRGHTALPTLTHDIVAFTAIVLGVQTVFGAFFFSAVADCEPSADGSQ